MEDILFSVGGPERIICTMRYFKDRQVVRELSPMCTMLSKNDNNPPLASNKIYLSKEERLSSFIVEGVKDFLGMFRRNQGIDDKGGGRRSLEDQNAYDAVMASIMSGDLNSEKLGRMLSRTLLVSHRQIKKGREL